MNIETEQTGSCSPPSESSGSSPAGASAASHTALGPGELPPLPLVLIQPLLFSSLTLYFLMYIYLWNIARGSFLREWKKFYSKLCGLSTAEKRDS